MADVAVPVRAPNPPPALVALGPEPHSSTRLAALAGLLVLSHAPAWTGLLGMVVAVAAAIGVSLDAPVPHESGAAPEAWSPPDDPTYPPVERRRGLSREPSRTASHGIHRTAAGPHDGSSRPC